MADIQWLANRKIDDGKGDAHVARLAGGGVAECARRFHSRIPGYHISPLVRLNRLAKLFGLGGVWVKDESQRLELNSFKVLGGAFAIYNVLRDRLGRNTEDISFAELTSAKVRDQLGEITFAAATDGNHGRGVAWAADKLHHRSVIYVPEGTAQARVDAIQSYGADVSIISGTYDDAVEQVKKDAEKNGWQVIADTAWPGYEKIPIWVMQGYMTMFSEVQEQLAGQGVIRPTHVFIQAGVGSLAAAVVAFYRERFGSESPMFVVTEPTPAACIFESARIGDGLPYKFEGDLRTIMAGLSCGRPNPIAWEVLWNCAQVFVSCPDYIAARGMRIYAVPLSGDPFIVSGESGAVTMGVLSVIMQRAELEPLRELLGLGSDSRVLLINTEGNTAPDEFRRVVWEGAYSVPESIRVARVTG